MTAETIMVLAQCWLLLLTARLAADRATRSSRWTAGQIVIGLALQAGALGEMGHAGPMVMSGVNAGLWAFIWWRRAA